MQTIESKLAETGYRPAGFDYLRLVLAIAVVCLHSYEVCYGIAARDRDLMWLRPIIALILPLFFGLSGFLVAGSLERTQTLKQFLAARAIRIVPALAVESALSALVLGVVFTVLPLGEYFTHAQFFSYFANIVGAIHYVLPGVFNLNPVPHTVNAQLWTVPYELWCYVVLSLFILLKIEKPFEWLFLLGVLHIIAHADDVHPRLLCVNGITLVASFISGAVCYRYRKVMPYSPWLGSGALGVCLCALVFPRWDAFAAFPAAYVAIWLGCLNLKRRWVVRSGDYSYGIFLYGYALQQALATHAELRHYGIHLALSLVAAFACAYLSWNYIEKPMLRLKARA